MQRHSVTGSSSSWVCAGYAQPLLLQVLSRRKSSLPEPHTWLSKNGPTLMLYSGFGNNPFGKRCSQFLHRLKPVVPLRENIMVSMAQIPGEPIQRMYHALPGLRIMDDGTARIKDKNETLGDCAMKRIFRVMYCGFHASSICMHSNITSISQWTQWNRHSVCPAWGGMYWSTWSGLLCCCSSWSTSWLL